MSHLNSPGMALQKQKAAMDRLCLAVAASERELESPSRPVSSASTRRFAESYSDMNTQSAKGLGVGATGARILRKEKKHSQHTQMHQQRQNRFLNATLQQDWSAKVGEKTGISPDRNRESVFRRELPWLFSSALQIFWPGCLPCWFPGTRNRRICLRAAVFAFPECWQPGSGPRRARA